MTRSTDKAPADWTRAALREALAGSGFVREITTGSMAPVLVPGDVVRLTRGVRPPRAGEIWAFESTSRRGQHIAHRVLCRRADGRVLTKGDNLLWPDGWIEERRLFGPALERCRDGRWQSLTGRRARAWGLMRTALGSLRLMLVKMAARSSPPR